MEDLLPLELWRAHIFPDLAAIDFFAIACTSLGGSALVMRHQGWRVRKRQKVGLFPLRFLKSFDIGGWVGEMVIGSGSSLGQLVWLREMKLFPRNIWRTCKARRYQPLSFLLRHKHLFKRCDELYPLLEILCRGVRQVLEPGPWLCAVLNVARLQDLPALFLYALLVGIVLPCNIKKLFPEFESVFWLLSDPVSSMGFTSVARACTPPTVPTCGNGEKQQQYYYIHWADTLWIASVASGDPETLQWMSRQIKGCIPFSQGFFWTALRSPALTSSQVQGICELVARGRDMREIESIITLAIHRRDVGLCRMAATEGSRILFLMIAQRDCKCTTHGYGCEFYEGSKAFLKANGWWTMTDEEERRRKQEQWQAGQTALMLSMQAAMFLTDTAHLNH